MSELVLKQEDEKNTVILRNGCYIHIQCRI